MAHRSAAESAAPGSTVRERILEALRDGAVTARDLSQLVGIREHDVAAHLEHVEHSLKHRAETLVIEPSVCRDCGFAFTQRHRYTRPGSCPNCRGRRISLPRFWVAPRR
jgi:predicted Zn-ribbon and HTH transcriptional regulator